MTKSVVIVESPAKARTISSFLGAGYAVEPSIGHIRDLPKSAADVPERYKKMRWSRLGVDVDNDFRPLYVLDPDKRATIAKLKRLLRDCDALLLATDEDREGESIAWHLLEVLKPTVPVKRMVFHEITPKAIEQAIASPRALDRRLVDAQEARRILDRLYGYEVSPVLWRKVMPRLSAGRVQSVATRMIVERERARIRFVAAGYWDVEAGFVAAAGRFTATSISVAGRRVATGRDFGEDGRVRPKTGEDLLVLDEAQARGLCEALAGARFSVQSLDTRPYRRSPSPPFMTSTLQQEAGRKLRFGAARTMRAAQRLYENGFITYMRTDSITLSEAAVTAARAQIRDKYGESYLPERPRAYRSNVKNAQEAHEAIRPAGDRFRTPDEVAAELGPDERRIYELVWKRTLASQMEDARGQRVQARVEGRTADGRTVVFAASGNTISFPGFLRAYVEGSDDPEAELEHRERHLPELGAGETVVGERFGAQSHETAPPSRYTEASLVSELEQLGVGRPSTYASIINTIVERGYVWKKTTALVPSFKAFAVVRLLEQHFSHLVDYAFTARMEDDLDQIAQGALKTVPWLRRFYFGEEQSDGNGKSNGGAGAGLRQMVARNLDAIDAREVNMLSLGRDEAGREVVVRVGRFGPYLQRGQDTANVPDDLAPDELTLARAIDLLQAPSPDRTLGTDPGSGLPVLLRQGRFGAYVQLGQGGDGASRPRTQSLLPGMSAERVTLAEAIALLSLPRALGCDPEGTLVTAHHGRYGSYVARGSDRRSLEHGGDVFTITLAEALRLLSLPRQPRRRHDHAPIRELGLCPVSGRTITLRHGRFGPYVTDGETNASLRAGDVPDGLTAERAQELLQLRRERPPTTGKRHPTRRAGGRGGKVARKGGAAGKGVAARTGKIAGKAARRAKAAKPPDLVIEASPGTSAVATASDPEPSMGTRADRVELAAAMAPGSSAIPLATAAGADGTEPLAVPTGLGRSPSGPFESPA